ncbi:MAG: hypothetical protein WBX38_04875 [Candidatus Sulfotelmatobacter sp.]
MKGEVVFRRVRPAFILVLAASFVPSSAQTGTPPLLDIIDFSGDSNVQPLVLVTGGQGASTLGIQVTSQSNGTASTAPTFSWVSPGYGGLSLVQTGGSTSTSGGQPSPVFTMCANQYGTQQIPITGGQGPACWYWQVQGGGAGNNPPDTLQLFRNNFANSTNNITVLFPASINLATAAFTGATPSAGQITVGPAPYGGTNANVTATFTGASTSSASAAQAGPVLIQPGQLTNSTPSSSSVEGALWLMQSYIGNLGTGSGNVGLLACSDTITAQGVVVCGTSTAATQIVGVYDSNAQQAGATITPIRYGRAPIKNFGSAVPPWTNGDYVCRDTTNSGYVVDNGTTPCNRGTYVGVSAGDPTGLGNTSSHAVDLVQEPIVQGGALMTFFCAGSVVPSGTLYMFPGALLTTCAQATSSSGIQPVSFTGTVRNLEVFYATSPGGSGVAHTDTFTVWKCPALAGCAATSISCQIIGSGLPSTCSDLSHAVSISQGDGIQIVDATGSSSGAANPRITIELQ